MGLEEVLNVGKMELTCEEDWSGFLAEITHSKVNLWGGCCGGSC